MFGIFKQGRKERINRFVREGAQLIDVRSASEFNRTHLPNSLNIPLQSIDSRMDEIDSSKPIIVYCAMGGRSTIAAAKLKSKGFKVIDAGGINTVKKELVKK